MIAEKTNRIIANRLRKLRLAKSLYQKDLAKKAGISTNYYARVERGEVTPSVEIIAKLSKALGVKSSDILPF